MIEPKKITIAIDGTQIGAMQWPHNTVITSTFPQPSLDPSCSIVDCIDHANPLNRVEATLDVFGSPVVRVCLCDAHFRLFGQTTEEHEKPDIVVGE